MTIKRVKSTIVVMLDIVTLGDDILRQECSDVKEFDSALAMLVVAMFDTLSEADGVGLAGPQVGVAERIFVVKIPNGEPLAFINPTIIETSVEEGPYEEGCLSLPGVYHEVIRPLRVTIQAQNVKGKAFTMKADGLLARVIQHENDHLHGKLYIDRLSDKDKEHMIHLYEKKNKLKKRKIKV